MIALVQQVEIIFVHLKLRLIIVRRFHQCPTIFVAAGSKDRMLKWNGMRPMWDKGKNDSNPESKLHSFLLGTRGGKKPNA